MRVETQNRNWEKVRKFIFWDNPKCLHLINYFWLMWLAYVTLSAFTTNKPINHKFTKKGEWFDLVFVKVLDFRIKSQSSHKMKNYPIFLSLFWMFYLPSVFVRRTKYQHKICWNHWEEWASVQTALPGCFLQGQWGVASLCESCWWEKEEPQSQ